VVALTRVLEQIDKLPDRWVRLGLAVPDGRSLGLLFNVFDGRRGRIAQRYRVKCMRVREWHLDGFDFGGIRLYGSDHPVARQYSASRARLRVAPIADGRAIAALIAAHTDVFDDWVPCDRYLGSFDTLSSRVAKGLSVAGPEFLLKTYARALRPMAPSVSVRRLAARGRAARLQLLHFSSSFVVAERFEVNVPKEVDCGP
jgi:hypothetical protein